MINIFILDDDVMRHRTLIKRALEIANVDKNEANIVTATTSDEAVKKLQEHDSWDILMLDHDLGGEIFVESTKENTGFQVAKFIRKNNIKFGQCLLHSMNPVGVKNMLEELEGLGDVYRSPFFLML